MPSWNIKLLKRFIRNHKFKYIDRFMSCLTSLLLFKVSNSRQSYVHSLLLKAIFLNFSNVIWIIFTLRNLPFSSGRNVEFSLHWQVLKLQFWCALLFEEKFFEIVGSLAFFPPLKILFNRVTVTPSSVVFLNSSTYVTPSNKLEHKIKMPVKCAGISQESIINVLSNIVSRSHIRI